MHLIRDRLSSWDTSKREIALETDRLTLSKRRWRGTAEDGADFGFDLERPLSNGDVFAATPISYYRVVQLPEAVLEVDLQGAPADSARMGWIIGNLHFPLEIAEGKIRVADDPALRQLFERERIRYTEAREVFRPLAGGHHH